MNLEKEAAGDPVDAALDALDLDDAPDTEGDDLRDTDEEEESAAKSENSEDEDSDEEDADEEGSGSAKSDGKKPRHQKRFNQLTRQKHDAERERDYYKKLYEESSRQPAQHQPQPTQQQYRDGAQQGLSRQQVEAWVEEAAQRKVQEAEYSSKVSGVRAKLEEGGAGEALSRLSNPAITNFWPDAALALSDSKFPVQVAKAIAGSDELFSQFQRASPAQQVALIARVDGRLEARAAQKSPKNPPATPQVRGKSRPPEKNPDDMDQAEYEAWSKKQGF